MSARIQMRRGTSVEWASSNPILSDGEIGFIRDLNGFKIGDGVTHWVDLPTYAVSLFEPAGAIADQHAVDLTLFEPAGAIADQHAVDLTLFEPAGAIATQHATDLTLFAPATDEDGALNGLKGWTFDPVYANTSSQIAGASGVLTLSKLRVPNGGPITNIFFSVSQVGSYTNGRNFIGVYDPTTGNLLGTSADITTTLQSTGFKTIPLVAPTASLPKGKIVYIAFLWGTTTAPYLSHLPVGTTPTYIPNTQLASPSFRFATAGSGYTTALPATLPTPQAATMKVPWFGVN